MPRRPFSSFPLTPQDRNFFSPPFRYFLGTVQLLRVNPTPGGYLRRRTMEPIKHWLMQKSSTGAIVLLSVALGASLAGRWDHPTAVTAADHVVVQAQQHAALAMLQDAFCSLADQVEPTVVSIQAIQATPTASS